MLRPLRASLARLPAFPAVHAHWPLWLPMQMNCLPIGRGHERECAGTRRPADQPPTLYQHQAKL